MGSARPCEPGRDPFEEDEGTGEQRETEHDVRADDGRKVGEHPTHAWPSGHEEKPHRDDEGTETRRVDEREHHEGESEFEVHAFSVLARAVLARRQEVPFTHTGVILSTDA